MSVTMTFYSGFSKRENSTKQPTGGTSYAVVFKDAFSIIGGTVKLQVNFDTAKNYTAAKYGNNFYNVVDVVSTTNNIVEITLTLDVLATYKSDIAAYSSMIERSPSPANIVDIVDNTIAPLAPNVKSYKTANVYSSGVCFQIKTKNGNGDLAYFLDKDGFDNLLGKFEAAFWTDETQYIISTKVVPIAASACGGTKPKEPKVYIGNQQYNITSGVCYAIKSQDYVPLGSNFVNTADIANKYSDERRYNNNYVRLQCKLNGDIIDLDANYLRYTAFKTESFLDPVTLDVRLEVRVATSDYNTGYLVASTHTNIGIGFMFTDVPNSLDMVVTAMSTMPKPDTTGMSGNATQLPKGSAGSSGLKGMNISLSKLLKKAGAKSTLGSAIGGISKALPGAIAAVISTAYNAGMSASTAGAPSGSSIAATMYGEITFYITEYESIDKNPSELGYPYMEITSINAVGMTGYYKFVAPQLGLAAMSDIKDVVNEYLANGFFYE